MARALEELPEVRCLQASHPGKMAVVVYNRGLVTTEDMCRVLFKAGFAASPKGENPGPFVPLGEKAVETKNPQATDLICYCFGYSKQDIEQDFIKNDRSLILEKIAAEKKLGGCDCANKNPKGR